MFTSRRVTLLLGLVLRARSSNVRQFPAVNHVCAVLHIAANEHHLPALAAYVDQLLRHRLMKAEPTLEVDFESLLMAAYLEERVPTPLLRPAGVRERARDLFWEEYADTRLVDPGPPIFFQRVVRQRIFKEPADEELVRRHTEELLPPVLDQIQSLFVDSGEADPQTPTLGAISIWSTTINLAHAGFEVDRDRWPTLVGFLEAMGRHEALARLVDEERSALASH